MSNAPFDWNHIYLYITLFKHLILDQPTNMPQTWVDPKQKPGEPQPTVPREPAREDRAQTSGPESCRLPRTRRDLRCPASSKNAAAHPPSAAHPQSQAATAQQNSVWQQVSMSNKCIPGPCVGFMEPAKREGLSPKRVGVSSRFQPLAWRWIVQKRIDNAM